MERHRYHGEPTCDLCKASSAHYRREKRRGQRYPKTLYPCGTWQAAKRHQWRGEDVDFPCKLAVAKYERERRAENRARIAA